MLTEEKTVSIWLREDVRSIEVRAKEQAAANRVETLGKYCGRRLRRGPSETNRSSEESLSTFPPIERQRPAAIAWQCLPQELNEQSIICNLLADPMACNDPVRSKILVAPRRAEILGNNVYNYATP